MKSYILRIALAILCFVWSTSVSHAVVWLSGIEYVNRWVPAGQSYATRGSTVHISGWTGENKNAGPVYGVKPPKVTINYKTWTATITTSRYVGDAYVAYDWHVDIPANEIGAGNHLVYGTFEDNGGNVVTESSPGWLLNVEAQLNVASSTDGVTDIQINGTSYGTNATANFTAETSPTVSWTLKPGHQLVSATIRSTNDGTVAGTWTSSPQTPWMNRDYTVDIVTTYSGPTGPFTTNVGYLGSVSRSSPISSTGFTLGKWEHVAGYFYVTEPGLLVVSSPNNTFDNYGYLHSGTSTGAQVASDDDSNGGGGFKITYPVSSSGYYCIEVRAYSDGTGTGTYDLSVQLTGNPQTVSISPTSSTITVGQSVTFTASGGNNGYNWWGSASGTGTTKTVTFNVAGTQYVQVNSPAGNGYDQSNTASATITVGKATQAAFTASSGSATFGNTISGTTSGGSGTGAVTWALGSGSTASGAAVTTTGTISATSTGTVVAVATKAADSNYNAATATTTATFTKAAQAPIGISPTTQTIQAGNTVSFTASGGTGTGGYTWGGEASGTGNPKTVTFNSPGVYNVSVYRVGDSNYIDSASATATITVTAAQSVLTITPTTGGTTTGSGAYAIGSTASVTASANAGYLFAGWDGMDVGRLSNQASSTTTISMTTSATISARFVAIADVVEKGTINFGSACIDTILNGVHSSARDAILENASNDTIQVVSMAIAEGASEFTAVPVAGPIASGGSKTAAVTFDPKTTTGTRVGKLVVVTTDSAEPARLYTLQGVASNGSSSPTGKISRVSRPGAIAPSNYTYAGDTIALQCSANDADGNLASIEWSINGSVVETAVVNGAAVTRNKDVVLVTGTNTVSVRVTDSEGLSSTDSFTFTATDPAITLTVESRAIPAANMAAWIAPSEPAYKTFTVEKVRGPM